MKGNIYIILFLYMKYINININYLSYIAPAYNQIFIKNPNKIWSQHRAFGLENYDEELYSPSIIYNLNKKTELPKLIYFYSAILEIPKESVTSVSKYYIYYIF